MLSTGVAGFNEMPHFLCNFLILSSILKGNELSSMWNVIKSDPEAANSSIYRVRVLYH